MNEIKPYRVIEICEECMPKLTEIMMQKDREIGTLKTIIGKLRYDNERRD